MGLVHPCKVGEGGVKGLSGIYPSIYLIRKPGLEVLTTQPFLILLPIPDLASKYLCRRLHRLFRALHPLPNGVASSDFGSRCYAVRSTYDLHFRVGAGWG